MTYLPDSPDIGESLTRNSIESVGSSTRMPESGVGSARSRIVWPISMSGKPESTKMSPAEASVTSTRLMPSNM